ncbi:MAG: amidase family protein [Opitutales bacterium]
MTGEITTFAHWRRLVGRDPEGAAVAWLAQVEALPATTRRAALAALPDTPSLASAFRQSSDRADGDPFRGIPFLLKDLFDVAGVPTAAGSRLLPQLRPTPDRTCPLAQRVLGLGGAYAGKTQMNEFAYGLSGENRTYGDCPHPRFPDFLSGGSSSGSAWAVGTGLVPLAFGTDTGGSIRVPASYCGIFGIRLVPNTWSREGCFPLAPSFDTAGWFTGTREDMQTSLAALLPTGPQRHRPLKGLWVPDLGIELMPELLQGYAYLAHCLGAEEATGPANGLRKAFTDAARAFSVLQSREAWHIHQAWLDPHRETYDPVVWKLIDRGRHWSSEDIRFAEEKERAVQSALAHTLATYDYLALPAVPQPAPYKEELTPAFRERLLALTTPGSLARLPALTLPVDPGDSLTGGVQILFSQAAAAIPIEVLHRAETFYRDRKLTHNPFGP